MAVFGGDGVFRSGAPRPVKVGTIRSPWRYEDRGREEAAEFTAHLPLPFISKMRYKQLRLGASKS
jgi:hypothetical protein